MRSRLLALFFIPFFLCVCIEAADPKSPLQTKQPLVLAHYMPWYSAKPTSAEWGWHWTMNHFNPNEERNGKRDVASRFYPLIGPYDSGDSDVLEYHLLTMKLAGIDGVIVDWYGLTQFNDYPILHTNTLRLVEQLVRFDMKLVICYEDQTLPALIKAKRLDPNNKVAHVLTEIEWMSKNWFSLENYVKLDDKPVLLSFGNSGLSNEEWTSCVAQYEKPIAYFSEHTRREGAIGGFDWPIPTEGVERTKQYTKMARDWPHLIPVAYPRFEDIYAAAKVSEGYPDIKDDSGKTFETTLKYAFQAKSQLIQLATWNDWGEGTNIEPSKEFGYRDLELLQKTRRKYIAPSFEPKAADLRLPHKLYELRKLKTQDESRLDTIAKNLSQGRLDLAKRQLDFLAAQANKQD